MYASAIESVCETLQRRSDVSTQSPRTNGCIDRWARGDLDTSQGRGIELFGPMLGSPISRSAGTKERIASGAKSAPLGQQTVLQTGSRVNFANMLGSRSGSKTGPDSSGRKSTVASQPSLKVTESEAGPASSAWSICKIIAINPKVQLGVKAPVPAREPSPRAMRRVESRTIQPTISQHFWAVVLRVFDRCGFR
jgi:hypothetical protein